MTTCPLRLALSARVPELADDLIEIVAVARQPGQSAKVAVRSRIPGINPVGACIGWSGLRISDVEKRLHGERVKIVAHHHDPAAFVSNALAVTPTAVRITDAERRDIRVSVEPGDYPRALGRYGLNLRLAAELTGWRIHLQTTDAVALHDNNSMQFAAAH